MIDVIYVRQGLHVVAYTVNGTEKLVAIGSGFTEKKALKRLLKALDAHYA